jgi:hypothetical protein
MGDKLFEGDRCDHLGNQILLALFPRLEADAAFPHVESDSALLPFADKLLLYLFKGVKPAEVNP